MSSRLLVPRPILALALALFPAGPAASQTIAVSVDPDGGAGSADYVQAFDVTPGESFDVVIWADTGGHSIRAVEFVVTELRDQFPEVFRLSTWWIDPPPVNHEQHGGEYRIDLADCAEPGARVDLIRLTYLDITGVIDDDQLLTLRGFQPGDTRPSLYGGEPGFTDCDDLDHVLTPGGTVSGLTGAGVRFGPGELVLEPTPAVVPTISTSLGRWKLRFDD